MIKEMAKLGMSVLARAEHREIPLLGEIEKNVVELKAAGAKIIFIDTDSVSDAWCLLHKNKMFGPAYVFFLPSLSAIPVDDPYRSNETAGWCTVEMVVEIYTSSHVFYLGDTSLSGVMKSNHTDSTGLSGLEFDEVLMNTLENPESSYAWEPERYRLYDQTMFAAFWLNVTEKMLNEGWELGIIKYNRLSCGVIPISFN